MKKIAIIGRPNVGKSSLFNRFAKTRDAIVSEVSGTTRDAKIRKLELEENKFFEVIDTGGIDDSNELFQKVKEKSLQMATEADIILYMVDGKTIPDDEDKDLFYQLQDLGKNIALVVNKIDNEKRELDLYEFNAFGSENFFPISVSHNRGVLNLQKWLLSFYEDKNINLIEDDEESFDDFLDNVDIDEEGKTTVIKFEEEDHIKIAIIGRPNVGKSSILNALVGEERSVVSSIAGTTVDPVDEETEIDGIKTTFIDTAGIRKRGKINGIEKYALMRTEKALEKANIALIILDASEEFKDLDEKIAGLVDNFLMGSIIVLNKWDIKDSEETYKKVIDKLRNRFKFLHYTPVIAVSANTGRSIDKVKEKILKIYSNYKQRIPTSKLNDAIALATRRHCIPSDRGRNVRIYYATQYDVRPPRIAVIMNRPQSLHFSYKRYLVNFIRANFSFEGIPIIITPRKKGERSNTQENLENKSK